MLLVLLSLLACADPLECGPGTYEHGGQCLPETEEEASMDELLASLPACDRLTGDGRVDLEGPCVDGACAGMRYEGWVAALGEAVCESYAWWPNTLFCDWEQGGIGTAFQDEDADGVPDAWDEAAYVALRAPFTGSTTGGLGIGAGTRCFVDALGSPDSVTWEQVADVWWPTDIDWSAEGVFFDDYSFDGEMGRAESLVLVDPSAL